MANDFKRAEVLQRLIQGSTPTANEFELLSDADPTEQQLIELSRSNLDDRIRVFVQVHARLRKAKLEVEPLQLWARYLPLAELITRWSSDRPRYTVGLTGIPGTGKTSLVRILSTIANSLGTPTSAVSLDDFYLTPSERKTRGHKWRAVPGTHDMTMLREFIESRESGSEELVIPQYDTRAETRLPPRTVLQPRLLLLEGWFIGARVPGYEFVAEALDHLVYLDADLEWAHRSRLNREARIRRDSGGLLGLSEKETESFWQEALLPGSLKWVLPLKDQADLVLKLDANYHINAIAGKHLTEGERE